MFEYSILDLGNTKARYNALLQKSIEVGWEPLSGWTNGATCFILARREKVELPVEVETPKAKKAK